MELKRGFSLIELIVVIGLLALLMLAISSTMLMSIVSSNRIRTTSTTKNAGAYALGQLQSMLRSAKSITACDSGNNTITIVGTDGGSTQILTELVGGATKIASNSGSYLTPSNTTVTNFSLKCDPSDTDPTIVIVSFDLANTLSTKRSTENPVLHFETSINLRNQ